MTLKLLRKISITALLLTFTFIKANAQFNKDIVIYPFGNTDRDDSILTTVKRVKALLKAQKTFEKTYLNKLLVFMPLPKKYDVLFKPEKPYLQSHDYKILFSKYPLLEKRYKTFDARFTRLVDSDNVETKAENVRILKMIHDSPQVQVGLLDIHLRSDYEVIMCPESIFRRIVKSDPRNNTLKDTIQNHIEQVLLGRPYNLDGYLNSINYIPFNLSKLKMPDLVEALIQSNLKLWQKIVDNPKFHNMIKGVKINDLTIYSDNKLWLNTNVRNKVIYMSPYLTRAVFNISFYQDSILRLANQIEEDDGDLRIYFHGKSGASVDRIDAAYFEDFVNRFSSNLFFVLGHELAHIYLSDRNDIVDKETACDTYAAYFYLKYFKQLKTGVFETMLISSIRSNELDYWGKGISKAALQKRYANLLNIEKNNTVNGAAVKVILP